jgi:hypothetical protein
MSAEMDEGEEMTLARCQTPEWRSPQAGLGVLRAIQEYRQAPIITLEERTASLRLYVAARQQYAVATGQEVEVDGRVDWGVDKRFLVFMGQFDWEEGRTELTRQIEEFEGDIARRLLLEDEAGAVVVNAALWQE